MANGDTTKQNYKYTELCQLYDGHRPKYHYTCCNCRTEFGREHLIKKPIRFCSKRCSGIFRTTQNRKKIKPYLRTLFTKKLMSVGMQKSHRLRPRIWVTNSKVNVYTFKDELPLFIELSFERGRTFGAPTETRTRFLGVKARESNP